MCIAKCVNIVHIAVAFARQIVKCCLITRCFDIADLLGMHQAYSRRQMPRKLANYFERGAPAADIPSSVLTSYAAVAKRCLQQAHCPTALRVQALRLQRLRRELGRRLAAAR